MPKKHIFVSCGQLTEEEKTFGQEILRLIDSYGMTGFFAEKAHDTADLNTALFKELQGCDGFVAILQKRGEVHYADYSISHRASVWIQQEIGILFYRSYLLQRSVPMRIYMEKGIRHEGLTTVSIINPILFENKEMVLEDLSTWIGGPVLQEDPVLTRREDLFRRRSQYYQEHHWLVLELVAAHSRSPGDASNNSVMRQDFFAILRDQGKTDNEMDKLYNEAWSKLLSDGLITRTDERGSGTSLKLEKQWWDLLMEELRNRARIK